MQVHTFVQAEEFVLDCILKCLDPEYQVDKVELKVDRFQSPWRRIQLFIWGGKDYMEQIKEDTYHEVRYSCEIEYMQVLCA